MFEFNDGQITKIEYLIEKYSLMWSGVFYHHEKEMHVVCFCCFKPVFWCQIFIIFGRAARCESMKCYFSPYFSSIFEPNDKSCEFKHFLAHYRLAQLELQPKHKNQITKTIEEKFYFCILNKEKKKWLLKQFNIDLHLLSLDLYFVSTQTFVYFAQSFRIRDTSFASFFFSHPEIVVVNDSCCGLIKLNTQLVCINSSTCFISLAYKQEICYENQHFKNKILEMKIKKKNHFICYKMRRYDSYWHMLCLFSHIVVRTIFSFQKKKKT